MERLQEKLGYRFRDRTLLTTALTHPSFGSDHHVAHYQRLEFLVEDGELALELALHLAFQFFDDVLQVQLRALQIVALGGHLLKALHSLAVLVQRGNVDHAHLADAGADGGNALLRFAEAEVRLPEGLCQRVGQLVVLPDALLDLPELRLHALKL